MRDEIIAQRRALEARGIKKSGRKKKFEKKNTGDRRRVRRGLRSL